MDPEIKIHFYRLTNVAYGILESCEFIRKELMKSLLLQARSQQKSFGQRLVGVALTVVAALPVLYELLPDDNRLRAYWLWAVIVLALLYFVLIWHQWRGARYEEKELDQLFPPGSYSFKEALAETNPAFIELQLSSCRTRWQMAHAIIEDGPPEPTLSMFKNIKDFWERELVALMQTVDQLHAAERLDEQTHERLRNWLPVKDVPAPDLDQ